MSDRGVQKLLLAVGAGVCLLPALALATRDSSAPKPQPSVAAAPAKAPPPAPAKEPAPPLDAPLEPAGDLPPGTNILDQALGSETAGEGFGLQMELSWSGYGDVILHRGGSRFPSFDFLHFTTVLSASMEEVTKVLLVLDFQLGGFRVAVERAHLDHKFFPGLNMRVGKFNLPLGRFNDSLQNSYTWNMVFRPMITEEVMPVVWPGLGAQLFGEQSLSADTSIEYAVYAVNGLGFMPHSNQPFGAGDIGATLHGVEVGRSDLDFPPGVNLNMEWWKGRRRVLAQLRDHMFDMSAFGDFNNDKAFGARVRGNLLRAQRTGPLSVGGSFYTGSIDPLSYRRLTIVDLDGQLKVGDIFIRGEGAQSFFGTDGNPTEYPFERGLYAQVSYRWGNFDFALRYDLTEWRPYFKNAQVDWGLGAGVVYSLNAYANIRGELDYATNHACEIGDEYKCVTIFEPHAGAMVAFTF